MISKNKAIYRGSLLFILISCLISASVLMYLNQPKEYHYLILLPVTFALISSLFYVITPISIYSNLGGVLVIMQLFIRNVVTPLIMGLGDYKSIFYANIYVTRAIGLMIYEVFASYLALYLFFYKNKKITRQTLILRKKINGKRFEKIVLILSIICVVLWMTFPIIHESYRTIFNIVATRIKDNPYLYTDYISQGTIERIGSTLFIFLFSFIRLVLPAYVIIRMYKINKSRLTLFLSVLFVGLQFLFIPNAVSEPLITAFLLIYLIQGLYQKESRIILILFFLMAISVVIVIFSLNYILASSWYGLDNIFQYLSNWFNTYFTGVDNVASVYILPHRNKLEILLKTIISAIPFRSTIMPYSIRWETINTLFTSAPGLNGQIVSTIGTGQYFFTFLFSPIFSFLFVLFAVYYGDKYKKGENEWKRIAYLYMCVQSAFGLGVYNVPITFIHWIQVGLPLLIISHFAGPDFSKKN